MRDFFLGSFVCALLTGLNQDFTTFESKFDVSSFLFCPGCQSNLIKPHTLSPENVFLGGGVALLYFFVAYLLFMGFKYTWFVVRGLNIVNTVLWCGKGQWVVQGHLLISLLFLQSWFFPGWWRGRKKGWRRAEEREMRFEGSYSSILSKRLKNWWCSVACDNKYFLKGLHLAFT